MHSTASGTFAVVLAGTVTANVFQLLNAAGNDVGDFGISAGYPTLLFKHNDSVVSSSQLRWSYTDGGTVNAAQQVVLLGPGGASQLFLGSGGPGATANAFMLANNEMVRVADGTGIILNTNYKVTLNGTQVLFPKTVQVVSGLFSVSLTVGGSVATGCLITLALLTGDQVLVHSICSLQSPAGGGFVQMFTYVNGAIQSSPGEFSNPGNTASIAIPDTLFVVPSAGNYTFDIRGGTIGGVAVSTRYASIAVTVFASK